MNPAGFGTHGMGTIRTTALGRFYQFRGARQKPYSLNGASAPCSWDIAYKLSVGKPGVVVSHLYGGELKTLTVELSAANSVSHDLFSLVK